MRKLTIILSLISSITFAQSVNSLIGNWKLINYDKKSKIYLHRAMGYLNAVIGRKSFFRPNIKI